MMSCDARKMRGFYRQCEIEFQLELSRGTSCISSSQTEASLHELVQETLLCFLSTYGPEKFSSFQTLLARKLAARGRRDAAAVVSSSLSPADVQSRSSSVTGPWNREGLS